MQLLKTSGLLLALESVSAGPSGAASMPSENNQQTQHKELLQRLSLNFPEFYSSNGIKSSKIEVLEEHSIGYYNDKHKKSPGFSKIKSNDEDDEESDTAAWEKQRDEFEYYRTYGYECYSRYGNTYYKKFDTWFTQRPFMDTALLAYYKCTCEGGDTGRYTCIPDSVPCYSQASQEGYDVNDTWDWDRTISFGEGRTVNDLYECHCEGGPKGKYKCSEKVQGCIDARHTLKKYQINEYFNQTREDNLTYECQCTKGEREEDRIIKCSLRNYCIYAGEVHEIGDTWDRYNRYTQRPEHRCACKRNPRNPSSNIVTCKYIRQPIKDITNYVNNNNLWPNVRPIIPKGPVSDWRSLGVAAKKIAAQAQHYNQQEDDQPSDMNDQADDGDFNPQNYSLDDLPEYGQPDEDHAYFNEDDPMAAQDGDYNGSYDESDYDDYRSE